MRRGLARKFISIFLLHPLEIYFIPLPSKRTTGRPEMRNQELIRIEDEDSGLRVIELHRPA